MSLLDRLNRDLAEAMRAHDEVRKRALRTAKAAIANAEVEKRGRAGREATLTDEEVLAVLARQAKQRRESIAEFTAGGRPDLVEQEQAELAVLESYLPRQLTADEIADVVRQVIAEVGATDPKQVGAVMRAAMERLRGQADGKTVNEIARKLLAEGQS
ncbi:MAG: GatB/YqeY domain-containing protein [Caldilineales bacterium]|nr:GatB/YqeY domain-containing protein [Caldilineales bacterium]MDW8318752.1 GatB/YqeY domain-containing protein [Anaerolineae bacterium]